MDTEYWGLDQETGNTGQYNAGHMFTSVWNYCSRDSKLVFLPSTCCTINTSKYALICKQWQKRTVLRKLFQPETEQEKGITLARLGNGDKVSDKAQYHKQNWYNYILEKGIKLQKKIRVTKLFLNTYLKCYKKSHECIVIRILLPLIFNM